MSQPHPSEHGGRRAREGTAARRQALRSRAPLRVRAPRPLGARGRGLPGPRRRRLSQGRGGRGGWGRGGGAGRGGGDMLRELRRLGSGDGAEGEVPAGWMWPRHPGGREGKKRNTKEKRKIAAAAVPSGARQWGCGVEAGGSRGRRGCARPAWRGRRGPAGAERTAPRRRFLLLRSSPCRARCLAGVGAGAGGGDPRRRRRSSRCRRRSPAARCSPPARSRRRAAPARRRAPGPNAGRAPRAPRPLPPVPPHGENPELPASGSGAPCPRLRARPSGVSGTAPAVLG